MSSDVLYESHFCNDNKKSYHTLEQQNWYKTKNKKINKHRVLKYMRD